MGNIGGRIEAVTGDKHRRLVPDSDLEAARGDVRRLAMRMMVQHTHGIRLELNAHDHEVGAVPKHLATDTAGDALPGGFCSPDERSAGVHGFHVEVGEEKEERAIRRTSRARVNMPLIRRALSCKLRLQFDPNRKDEETRWNRQTSASWASVSWATCSPSTWSVTVFVSPCSTSRPAR